jgi:hypothetical protein
VQWTFSPEKPAGHAACLVDINEVVPHAADFAPLFKEMEGAYSTGARSVSVTFTLDGKHLGQLYLFSKVCLFLSKYCAFLIVILRFGSSLI